MAFYPPAVGCDLSVYHRKFELGWARRKQVPAEQTNAENFYYLKQMQNHTPMVVVLEDGTELTGWIEWYDKTCVKLNRTDAPNLLLFKHAVKFMFKEEERQGRRRKRPPKSR